METGFIISGCTKDEFFTELRDILTKTTNSPQTSDKLLTQAQACQYLNISKPTMIAWAKQGIVKSTKLERRVYYKESDLFNISANKGK
jgi:excisionase family DNA binding protein